MNVELICVGSELVSGDAVNTNASYISKRLRELGHDSYRQFTVDDNRLRLRELVEQSVKRCDILILTGGLGPTADDITKETVCKTLGVKLTDNEMCRKHIEYYFKSLNKVPTENNYKQAIAPDGAVIFPNNRGTACGFGIELGDKRIIMLPGPPKELTHMFDTYVVPYLKKLNHHAIVTHTLNVFGMGESAVESIIRPFCEKENPVVATYCSSNECSVKITATADTEPEAEAICSKTMLRLKELLGDVVYGADSDGLATEVVNSLRVSGLKISTAESCTGGMLSQALTSVSHSSEVVEIGILAYSNRIKHEALSVPRDVLEENGAISPETAMYLAKNVRILSDSDIGVGITGNAGPSASENKPVGLVYIAIADKTKYFIKKLQLPPTYDRERIRSYATLTALDLVRRYVSARPFALPRMVSFDTEFVFEEEVKPTAPENSVNEQPRSFDPNMNFIVFESENYDETEEYEPTAPAVLTTKASATAKSCKKKLFSFFANIAAALKSALPSRNDKVKDIAIKIVSIVALIGLILSSSMLIYNFAFENNQRQIIQQARVTFDYNNEEKHEDTKQYSIFDELMAQNPDIRGWISISNTNIDNPIYQSDDNDYYLHYNMLKKKSRYGALFFDCNNNIELQNKSKNLTVYGHNTRDKSMFGTLRSYRSLKFYKQNPIIKLKTLYEQNDYVIFSIMITNASAKDDNGYLYNFTRSEFSSDEDFLSWIAEAKERSLVNTGVEIQPDDEILTLSTCCYDFDNARFVVMAKKIPADEGYPDISDAKLNPNVRYPQAWYDEKGLEGYKKAESENSSSATSDESSSTDSSISTSEGASSDVSSDISSADSSSSFSSGSSGTVTTACVHQAGTQLTIVDSNKHSYICTKCKATVHVAHTYDQQTQKHKAKDANCGSGALYYKTCVCGAKGTETFVFGKPEGEHLYGEWETVKEATTTESGSKKRTCSVCGHAETEEIPKITDSSDSSELGT